MKRGLPILAVCGALAACGPSEDAPPDIAEPLDNTLESAAISDMAGTYEIRNADGTVTVEKINSDGTYVDATEDGTAIERGTWRTGENGTMCFDPDGDAAEACFTGGEPGESGSFEVRDADGKVRSTVRKIEVPPGADITPAK